MENNTVLNYRVEYVPPRNQEILELLTYDFVDYPYMMEMTFTTDIWDWCNENEIRPQLFVFENVDPWVMSPSVDIMIGFETKEAATLFKLTWIG